MTHHDRTISAMPRSNGEGNELSIVFVVDRPGIGSESMTFDRNHIDSAGSGQVNPIDSRLSIP